MTTDADRLMTMYALLNEACTTSGEPSGAWRALAFSAVQEYRLSRQLVESRPTALDVAFGALPTKEIKE